MLGSDQIEYGQAGLAIGDPQSAAELLEKDGGALGGAQQQHCVDLGQVDPLVEEIHRTQDVDVAIP